MKLSVLCLFGFLLMWIPNSTLAADSADIAVAEIKAIAGNWQTAIQKQTLILAPSTDIRVEAWYAIRLSTDSAVSFDVKKTDSLVSPYMGIIQISGTVESNMRLDANGFFASCFQTPEQALADPIFKSPFGHREYVASYNFNDGCRSSKLHPRARKRLRLAGAR